MLHVGTVEIRDALKERLSQFPKSLLDLPVSLQNFTPGRLVKPLMCLRTLVGLFSLLTVCEDSRV